MRRSCFVQKRNFYITAFQVFFRVGEREYQYYLSVREEIVEETLLWRTLKGKRPGVLFERSGQNVQLGDSIRRASINTNVNPQMPYLTLNLVERTRQYAEKLAELNKGKQPSESAPGTQVHELMKKLKPYL